MQFLARAPHDAVWLLWAIIGAQLIMAVCVWQLHVQPPVLVRNIGIALAGLVLPALMAFLYAAWSDPDQAAHDRGPVGRGHLLAAVLPPAVAPVLHRAGRT